MQAYIVRLNGGFDGQHSRPMGAQVIVHARNEAAAREAGAAMLGTSVHLVTATPFEETATLGTIGR